MSGDMAIAELVAKIKAAATAAEIRILRSALRRAVRERDVADMTGPARTIDPDGGGADPGEERDVEEAVPTPPTAGRRHPARRRIFGPDDDHDGHGRRNDLKATGALHLGSEGRHSQP